MNARAPAARAPHLLGDQPADLADGVGRLLRAHLLGQRRRGHVERLELLAPAARPARGPAARARGRASAAARSASSVATCSFARIISSSIRRVRLGLLLAVDAPRRRRASSNSNCGSSRLDLERAAPRAPLAQRGRDRARGGERLRPRLLGALLAREDAVDLRRSRAARRCGSRCGGTTALTTRSRLHLELDRHRVAVLVRHEAAGLVRERLAAASARPRPGRRRSCRAGRPRPRAPCPAARRRSRRRCAPRGGCGRPRAAPRSRRRSRAPSPGRS